MARNRSKEVFLDAMGGKKLTDSRQTQEIAAKLATGNYPPGLDNCFVMGTMGQCGLDCFVFRDGECRFPLENLDEHHATAEQAQEIYDEGYYDDVVAEYCKLKGYPLNEAAQQEPNGRLTLEELRGMTNADWVWVVFPELPRGENCWYRAKKLYALFSHAHYGKTWLAYRRPPEAEAALSGGAE